MRRDGLSPQITDEDWDTVLTTNLTGAFRLTRRAVRTMIRARFGRIVNIASIVGIKANPGQSNYAAAKAGLIGMTHTVAAEVARRGVTVNAVAPGFIQTDMTEELTDDWLKLIPARRLGTPEDVAACRPVPRLRGRRVRHRHHADRRRRPHRLAARNPRSMSTATREEIARRVIETLASFGPAIEDLKPEATLEELDIDSLDIAELAQVVEDEYGVEISGDDAACVATVGDTIDLVIAKLP